MLSEVCFHLYTQYPFCPPSHIFSLQRLFCNEMPSCPICLDQPRVGELSAAPACCVWVVTYPDPSTPVAILSTPLARTRWLPQVDGSGWLLCTLWVLAVGSTKVRACYIVSADVCSCPCSQDHPLRTCLLLELHAPLPSPGEALVCACTYAYT